MADHFRELGEGLKQASEGIVQAAQGLIAANAGLQRALEASLLAHDEQEDLGETVKRLEVLVLDLVRRERERGNGH